MDVQTIVANIKSQAQIGATGDATDNERLMRYLNKAYTAIYTKCAMSYPEYFGRIQTVTILNGAGTPNPAVLDIQTVVDTGQNFRILERRSRYDIEMGNPSLNRTGYAETYDLSFSGLTTYPVGNTTLRVRYTPRVNVLTQASAEADIMLPPAFHEVLEWETLVTLSYDERDVLVGAELNFTMAKRDACLSDLMFFLQKQKPLPERRVQTV